TTAPNRYESNIHLPISMYHSVMRYSRRNPRERVLPHPGLVAKSMSMTCRVRRNPPVHEIILYKDGIEVQRERGLNPQILLTSLRPEDEGMYSCRASWDVKGRTISVISAPTYVQIPGEFMERTDEAECSPDHQSFV
uniref:Ig-like domain-containing protein n=1 Tax=Salarias fasciatus TaxID=181472 RepID=A0A672F7Z8_SALFA